MANKVKGGPDTGAAVEAVGGAGSKHKSVTLLFSTDAEIAVYNRLAKEAEDDDRPLSKFIVRKLKAADVVSVNGSAS